MMVALLHIDASPRLQSTSRRLSQRFADRWRSAHPTGRVVYRDLGADPLPHVSESQADHFLYQPGCHELDKPEEVLRCERLIDELRGADLLLLATPMHNFTVASTLKTWLDHVMWPGYTFDATGRGGLLDLPAVVVLSRAGGYGPHAPRADHDFQEPYLRTVLAAIGITDVTFVIAELTAFTGVDSPDQSLKALGEQSLRDAVAQIDHLCPLPADARHRRAARSTAAARS